mgnify:FL=1|jgi:hypothetical protein
MEKKLVKGLEKLINSDVIKSIYPMIDHIDIKNVRFNSNNFKPGYLINFDIVVDSPDMTEDNMYDLDFDPHYLADKHIRDLSKYLSIDISSIFFTVHNLEGDLIHEWNPF